MDIQGRRGKPLELSRSKQSLMAKLNIWDQYWVSMISGLWSVRALCHLERKSDRRTSCAGDNLCVSVRYEEPPSSGLRIINISVSLLINAGRVDLTISPPLHSRIQRGWSHPEPGSFIPAGTEQNMIWSDTDNTEKVFSHIWDLFWVKKGYNVLSCFEMM